MSLAILDTSNLPIGSLTLAAGVAQTIRISNAGAVALTVKMFATGYDQKSPVDCSNTEGKEIAEEGFVGARLSGVGEYSDITWPETITDFDSQATGLELSIEASGAVDVDVLLTPASDAETAGTANFGILFVGGPA